MANIDLGNVFGDQIGVNYTGKWYNRKSGKCVTVEDVYSSDNCLVLKTDIGEINLGNKGDNNFFEDYIKSDIPITGTEQYDITDTELTGKVNTKLTELSDAQKAIVMNSVSKEHGMTDEEKNIPAESVIDQPVAVANRFSQPVSTDSVPKPAPVKQDTGTESKVKALMEKIGFEQPKCKVTMQMKKYKDLAVIMKYSTDITYIDIADYIVKQLMPDIEKSIRASVLVKL